MSMIIDGTNGLTFNNATTQASAGSVIQVVNATYSTQTSNGTTTYADTGLTATITPKFATSTILVIVNHPQNLKDATSSANGMGLRLLRGASVIVTPASFLAYSGVSSTLYFSASFNYVDSPATTSATTYKTQFVNNAASTNVFVQANNQPSTITLLEIAA